VRPQKPCHQPHGTISRYTSGCSCLECCEAKRRYNAKTFDAGRKHYIRQNQPSEPVRRHVRRLLNHMSARSIAESACVSRTTVKAIRDGRYSTVKRETADAILGVCVPTARRPVDHERILLLRAEGLDVDAIACHAGCTTRTVWRVLAREVA